MPRMDFWGSELQCTEMKRSARAMLAIRVRSSSRTKRSPSRVSVTSRPCSVRMARSFLEDAEGDVLLLRCRPFRPVPVSWPAVAGIDDHPADLRPELLGRGDLPGAVLAHRPEPVAHLAAGASCQRVGPASGTPGPQHRDSGRRRLRLGPATRGGAASASEASRCRSEADGVEVHGRVGRPTERRWRSPTDPPRGLA